MKTIQVKKIKTTAIKAVDVPALLDANNVEFERIACVNWQEDYPYAPQVKFRIAHTGTGILVHYHVEEESVRAVAAADNGHVWEDSCCEFFSALPNDEGYYNMECNAAGTLLIAYGAGREQRETAAPEVLEGVDRWASLGRSPFEEQTDNTSWDLALVIPVQTYFKHQLNTTDGLRLRANFYKCGDALRTPHFLSWSPITIAQPDFHRSDFFGELVFE